MDRDTFCVMVTLFNHLKNHMSRSKKNIHNMYNMYNLLYNLLYTILLNIMFHVPMGRLQLDLIYCFTFIFHRQPI